MTMNIGDLVMTPKGVARITNTSGYFYGTTRGGCDPRNIHLLRSDEAFEIAGHPVPEGRLCWADADDQGDACWFNVIPPHPNSRTFQMAGDGWGEWFRFGGAVNDPDLRRTPASDTWDALPQVVREKVEEAAEKPDGGRNE